jgi:hypothetical protein
VPAQIILPRVHGTSGCDVTRSWRRVQHHASEGESDRLDGLGRVEQRPYPTIFADLRASVWNAMVPDTELLVDPESTAGSVLLSVDRFATSSGSSAKTSIARALARNESTLRAAPVVP